MTGKTEGDIEGVLVKPLARYCDERGYLLEVLRDDDGLLGLGEIGRAHV